MKTLIKRHYHWVIALVVLLELAVYTGILNNFGSLFLVQISDDIGIPRASFSLTLSLKSFIGFTITMFSGPVVLRFGYRKLVTFGLLATCLAYWLYASAQNLPMLYLAAAMLGLSDAFCTTASASRIISTWFHRHQGLVLGIVSASTGIGGSILCIFISGTIERADWRTAMVFLGILIAIVAVIMLLVVRNRPEDMNLKPLGHGSLPQKKQRKREGDHWLGYTSQEIYRKPAFYLMILSTLLACMSAYSVYNVLVPHLQERGFSPSEAATLQSMMLLGLTLAKIICGALFDVIGSKTVTIFCMVCSALSLLLLTTTNTFLSASVAVIVFAFALPLTSITVPALGTALFGYRTQNTTVGIFLAMAPAASMIVTPIVNASYDRLGTYDFIFRLIALCSVGVITLYLVMFILARRDRKRYEQISANVSGNSTQNTMT